MSKVVRIDEDVLCMLKSCSGSGKTTSQMIRLALTKAQLLDFIELLVEGEVKHEGVVELS